MTLQEVINALKERLEKVTEEVDYYGGNPYDEACIAAMAMEGTLQSVIGMLEEVEV